MKLPFISKKATPIPKTSATDVATATATLSEPVERSHAEIMVVVTALMLAMLLAALDQTIVATALPRIASDLHGLSKYSWVATSYLLTSAVATPLYGKISDMFGRKKIFQSAIVIFLLGSALCGLSHSMNQLIFFRGLQGIGAGGLMTLVFAIIGDIVSPRQRGRYQGYFGAVFAVSSVVGPLLGGLFADAHTFLGITGWRWIFYINLPIGAVALTAIATRLHLPVHRSPHKIDYGGAALLAISIVSLLLATVWGGVDYAWTSVQIIGLFAAAAVGALLFVWREHYAKEPIIPLRLFKNEIFSVTTILSLLVGLVMFGAIIFLPEYQQLVRGDSATKSGLMLLPLVIGIMSASLTSGRLISRFGRYRPFPIIGTAVITLGFFLFSHISIDTNRVVLGVWMYILGAGIGMVMPVLTLAVQNAVERRDLGAGTSSVVFFRSVGSSLGAAVFGAILSNRLTHHLSQTLPGHAGASAAKGLQNSAASLTHLPVVVRQDILVAFAKAFSDVFFIAIPFAALAFGISLLLKESPLRQTAREEAGGEGMELV
ncbi:MAG TPA: MDR family MFS transporter [Candidatus Saccharimonadales bacterium]|nr:MDR family MFS transporter [Candidatus Saccharimonadales bacterium]